MTTQSKSQADRFIEAARELGADEDEATFKAKLAVIGRQKLGDAATLEAEKAASNKKRPSDVD